MHAITTANNALLALIDNHLHQGNALGIDQRRIIWKRVVDLNDRALRHVTVGLGSPVNGIPREDGFDITVASEIMAILCLATDIEDLKKRLANIVIGYRFDRSPVYVRDLEDHYVLLSHLLDLSVSQLSTLLPLHFRHDVRPYQAYLRTPPLLFRRRPPQSNCPPCTVSGPDDGLRLEPRTNQGGISRMVLRYIIIAFKGRLNAQF